MSTPYQWPSDQFSHSLLVRELCKVTEWDVLGIYLGLDESEITEIERDHQSTARRRIKMLAKWMEKDPSASWEKAIDALEIMAMNVLAKELKEKYTSPLSSQPQASRIESPEKVVTVDRQEMVVHEIEGLERKYLDLVMEAESAVEISSPPLRNLERFSQRFMNKNVSSVKELFNRLKPFYLFKYALLEMVVKFFLPREHVVIDQLRDYHKELVKFKSSTTLLQFMEHIQQSKRRKKLKKNVLCTVAIHLVDEWLSKSMDDLEKLVKELFKEKAYVLSHLKIVRGSLIVNYLAPLSDDDSLVMLAKKTTEDFMAEVGIQGLNIGSNCTMRIRTKPVNFSFESSLLRAVAENRLNLLSFLLSINTNPDAVGVEGQTALMTASYCNLGKAAILLLQANADPNAQRRDGMTALNIASQKGHLEVVKVILKANASKGDTSQKQRTELVLNAKTIVPSLRTSGDDETPLYIACESGNADAVALLLKIGANPNYQTRDGTTPLCIASQNGYTTTIALLLEANANPDLQRNDGESPLHIASKKGFSNIIALLLKANANPNLQANNGAAPIHIACMNHNIGVIVLLLEANANPNLCLQNVFSASNSNGSFDLSAENGGPLHLVCQNGHTDGIALLLKAKADPDLQTDNGLTPLHLASLNGHTTAIHLLLKAKASLNIRIRSGETPLYMACQNGHNDVITLLLEANADPNIPAYDGVTPLYIASQNGHSEAIALLLKENVDPNCQASNGTSPLNIASGHGHSLAISLLLTAVNNHWTGPVTGLVDWTTGLTFGAGNMKPRP